MKTYAFIDASNLFYGGEKSLSWKIDYKKLFEYFKSKYRVEKVFYFGGVEIHKFSFDYLQNETVPIGELEEYLFNLIKEKDNFDRVIVLSGDGDFLPVLKYLREIGKEVIILARGPRTAKEIKQFASGKFMDFEYLHEILKWIDEDVNDDKNERHPYRMPFRSSV